MIYLIITACVRNRFGVIDPESRRRRYIECISATLRLLEDDIRPIVVENSGDEEFTRLLREELGCADVLNTSNNNNNNNPPPKRPSLSSAT